MTRKILTITLVLLGCVFVQAKKKSAGPDLTTLNQATAKYRKAKMVQVAVEKMVKSELTGKESDYKGTIYLSSGLFRMVNTEPEKSTLVFDGTTLWNEEPPSPDFPGPVQVTKTKIAAKNKSQTLFAVLMSKEPITKNFKITSADKGSDVTVYKAQPLNSEAQVKELTLKITNQTKQVSEISYQDDIGNTTTLKFSDPQFKNAVDKKLFQYKPPKGAQVSEL